MIWENSGAQTKSAKRSSGRFCIISFLIATQMTCLWFLKKISRKATSSSEALKNVFSFKFIPGFIHWWQKLSLCKTENSRHSFSGYLSISCHNPEHIYHMYMVWAHFVQDIKNDIHFDIIVADIVRFWCGNILSDSVIKYAENVTTCRYKF